MFTGVVWQRYIYKDKHDKINLFLMYSPFRSVSTFREPFKFPFSCCFITNTVNNAILTCRAWLLYLQAVCCSDQIHYCPNGYSCDVTSTTCNPNTHNGRPIPWIPKQPSQPIQVKLRSSSSILCPDKQGTCPDNSTCCIMMSGTYGCCPYPKVSDRLVTYLFL